MNIVVDAANIPKMPAGTKYNQGAAYNISLVLQVVYTAWDWNLLNWYYRFQRRELIWERLGNSNKFEI